jgi:hypothetical protein
VPRRLALAALWIVATVAAILLASFAVRLAGENVVADGPATVTRAQVEDDLAAAPGSTVAETTTTPPPADPSSTPADPSASLPPQPTSPTSPTDTTSPTVAGPVPTIGAPSPTTTSAPGVEAAPPPGVPVPVPVEQSFALVGGTVRMRCVGTTASLVASSPNPGFAMDVRATGPDRVEVRFEGDRASSELKGSCVGGQVTAEPKESGEGDDRRGSDRD